MWEGIVAALIEAASNIWAALISKDLRKKNSTKDVRGKNCKKSDALEFLDLSEGLNGLLGESRNMQMYTINSYILLNQVSMLLGQNENITLNKVTIMVRKKANENQSDLEHLEHNIEMWKRLESNKRINELLIIAYDHDPDQYYTLIGDETVFFGQVFYDDTLPTGMRVNYNPMVARNTTREGRRIIKSYQEHFDNVVNRYKASSTLYSSNSNA